MNISSDEKIYRHRDFPPLDAEPIGEHTIEAASRRVPGTIAHREDLWQVCHEDLMAQARVRTEQEVARLGGHYAHVFEEAIDSRRDALKNEAWLHGRFDYVLYRRQTPAGPRPGNTQEGIGVTRQAGATTGGE